MVDWQNNFFKRREQLRTEINNYDAKHGRHSFPASMGLRMAKLDIEWWAHNISDANKKKQFIAEANKLIIGKKFARGMDVPRGVAIEHLYYRIAKGYTNDEYAEHLASYD